MTRFALVLIGASWGGLHAVGRILTDLPADFAVPVLIVQHRGEMARGRLPDLLNRAGPLPVTEVEDKMPLAGGRVFVAPPGYHVLVEQDHFALSTEAAVRFSRPSIDVALESAAATFGRGVIGVVLTGNNEDGAAGLAEVRRRGGIAIVQAPESSERATMPAAARAAARPQAVAELPEIASLLLGLVQPSDRGARP
jgi:two-component system, chemotaxis family, protein-glutamate methylesterase/glutaminase